MLPNTSFRVNDVRVKAAYKICTRRLWKILKISFMIRMSYISTDYALWDVIENRNAFKPAAQTTTNADGTSTKLIPGPITTEEKVQKNNDVKTRNLNLKFLRSLPSEWNTHVVVWRNKPDLDTMGFDDLYNYFKIIEQEVKRTTSSSLSSLNIAFVSYPSSTKEINTAYGVSTASTQVSTTSTQVSTANLSDATVYAFLASQPNRSQLIHEDLVQIHEDDLEEMDLKWQLALLSMRTRKFSRKLDTLKGVQTTRDKDSWNKNQDSSRRIVNMEETSSKAMVAIDGAGFDWSYMTDDEVPTNMALMSFLDSEPEFEGYRPKTSKSVSEDIFNKVRESPDALLVKKLVSEDKLEKKTIFPTVAKIEFVRPKQQQKPVWKPVKYAKMYSFDHVQAHYNYHQRKRVVSGNNYTMVNYNYSTKKAHPSAHTNMAPRAVLMKTCLRPLNTARLVNTAHPKTTIYSARPISHFSKSAQSTIKKPYQIRTALTNKIFSQNVNTAKGKFYTARPNLAIVNVVRENRVNVVKASTCWVWRPTKLNDALITLKKHNYVDARGISKSVMAWVLKEN
nr:hypothetical protein [Tanacetum cinerariifolium]